MTSRYLWGILAGLNQLPSEEALALAKDLLRSATHQLQHLEGRIRELERWQEDRLDYEERR